MHHPLTSGLVLVLVSPFRLCLGILFLPVYEEESKKDILSYDPYGPARAFIAKLLRKSPYEILWPSLSVFVVKSDGEFNDKGEGVLRDAYSNGQTSKPCVASCCCITMACHDLAHTNTNIWEPDMRILHYVYISMKTYLLTCASSTRSAGVLSEQALNLLTHEKN